MTQTVNIFPVASPRNPKSVKVKRFLTVATACCLAPLSVAISSPAAQATTITSSTEVSPNPVKQGWAGKSVAMSADGNTAIVAQVAGNWSGANAPSKVFVYKKSSGSSSWTLAQTLQASDATNEDMFGVGLALSADGSTLAISSSPKSGVAKVYLYTKATSGSYGETQKLSGPDAASSGSFGMSLALSSSGADLVVGASNGGTNSSGARNYQGVAFLYAKSANTWTMDGAITGASDNAYLGQKVAISGNGKVAAISQPMYSSTSGTTKTFIPHIVVMRKVSGTNPSWSFGETIVNPQNTTGLSNFGMGALSLSDSGNTILVGNSSIGYINGKYAPGGAWTLDYSTTNSQWTNPTLITRTVSASVSGRELGVSGAINPAGTGVILGDDQGSPSNDNTTGNGVAYSYVRSGSTWTYQNTYGSSSGGGSDKFGFAVAIGNDPSKPVIGAPMKTVAGLSNAGAGYLF